MAEHSAGDWSNTFSSAQPTPVCTPIRCGMPADLKSIMKLEVPVIVQIAGRQMHVDEVLNLTPGSIVELPKSADDQLELLVNNMQIGTGSAVKVGENFGLRVNRIDRVKARVRALGGPNAADEAVTPTESSVD